MTYDEIVQLEHTASVANVNLQIRLIELYCTDYTKICANNVIRVIYLQNFKLLWSNLKKLFPNLSKIDRVLQVARTFKSEPNKSNFKTLINVLKQESVTLGEPVNTLFRLITDVLVVVSKHMIPLLDHSFGRYANTPIATRLISGFVDKPSYKSFFDMIDCIESFGQSHDETYLAKELLQEIYTFIRENDISKFKDLEDRCRKAAQLTGTTDELNFIQELLLAQEGNINAMLAVGEKYERGIGIKRDENLAEKWYSKAVIEGHPNAQFFLSNLHTKQHQKQIEEQNKHLFLEQQKLIEKITRELREEREKTRQLEQERLEEEKRHNQKIENLQRQLTETTEAQIAIMRNTCHNEKKIRVFFFYTYVHNNGLTSSRQEEDHITSQTYNSLITGGEYALVNYIHSNFCYNWYDGDSIRNARMRKLD
ncbi:MAG: hypothetical protein K2L22_12480 [Muribaculaceae bacterium]|nr:hypothetical protein [Muribaculaceae bacterium]